MTTYLIRRLFLMIPTLIGITFLVFMLIALSPGGIGAGLDQVGGEMDSSARAQQEAYVEDRYGLADPPAVQYVRWLRRVSPIKFGRRDQIRGDDELVSRPRPIRRPVLMGHWYAHDAVPTPPAVSAATDDPETLDKAYHQAEKDYSTVRIKLIEARSSIEAALRDFSTEAKLPRMFTRRGKPIEAKFKKLTLADVLIDAEPGRVQRIKAAHALVLERGEHITALYRTALQERARLDSLFLAHPYRDAGKGISNIVGVAMPDFGHSYSRGEPVLRLVKRALPVTLMLNFIAFPIIYMIALPSGIVSATHRGTWIDVSSGALFVALWSVPVVWAGVLAIGYLANNKYLGWFPTSGINAINAEKMAFLPHTIEGAFHPGYLLDRLWHVCLPVLCLVYNGFAILSKQMRAAMLDNFNADYVRTAKAKGVAPKDVVMKHVFRNSLLPIITMFASIFPAMLAGSVVIESIFSIEGMGKLTIDAIELRDRELLLTTTLMIAMVNLVALLIADILYALADPRVTYD